MAYDTKYSSNESLDRILRLLKGESTNEAPNSLQPPVHSWDESLSDIAELLAGTLEGEQAVVPIGMDAYGIMYAYDGTTGTVLSSGTWVAVDQWRAVGDYRNVTIDVDTPITGYDLSPDKDGHFMIGYNLTVAGTKDATLYFAVYSAGTVLGDSRARIKFPSSGTYWNISAVCLDELDAGNSVQLIVTTETEGANFALVDGQMWIKGL